MSSITARLSRRSTGSGAVSVSAVFAPLSQLEGALGPDKAKFPIGRMAAPNLNPSEWQIGMAVKQDGHDLAYRIGDVVTELLDSGTVKGIIRPAWADPSAAAE